MFEILTRLFTSSQSPGKTSQLSATPPAEMVDSGLLSWWIAEFSEAERRHILTKYLGLGSDPHADIAGIIGPDGSLRIKLTALATWFMSPKEDLPLALRLLRKGISLGEENQGTVLDQHFTLNNLIKVYYRDRANDALSLDLAIGACEKQIALAPLAAEMFKREERMETLPAHRGFEQLAIIREREGDYGEVVRLSSEALQQGWSGNWERRIARCDTKKESPA